MPSYSPDELKAIVIHYGNYRTAAKKLGIKSASTLIDAAMSDVNGTGRKLSPENSDRVYKRTRKFSDKTKREIRQYEKMFDLAETGNIKRVLMNVSNDERKEAARTFQKYRTRLRADTLVHKAIGKLYDKHGWERGRWSR